MPHVQPVSKSCQLCPGTTSGIQCTVTAASRRDCGTGSWPPAAAGAFGSVVLRPGPSRAFPQLWRRSPGPCDGSHNGPRLVTRHPCSCSLKPRGQPRCLRTRSTQNTEHAWHTPASGRLPCGSLCLDHLPIGYRQATPSSSPGLCSDVTTQWSLPDRPKVVKWHVLPAPSPVASSPPSLLCRDGAHRCVCSFSVLRIRAAGGGDLCFVPAESPAPSAGPDRGSSRTLRGPGLRGGLTRNPGPDAKPFLSWGPAPASPPVGKLRAGSPSE